MSRFRIITVILGIALISTVFGYLFYLEKVEVYSLDKEVKFNDVVVNIDEVLLKPRYLGGEPFYRELTVKGIVTDTSTDGKYSENLSELVKSLC